MTEKICKNCAIRYKDNFCMQNCYYVSDDHSCKLWTDKPLDFNYELLYRLCKQYVKLCDDYKESKELMKKYPEHSKDVSLGMHSYEFFFNCTINDLHRELSLWKTRR